MKVATQIYVDQAVYTLVLLALTTFALLALPDCHPGPLSNKTARLEIAERCTNFAVGLTRILNIQHADGEIDAVVTFEFVNPIGGIERQEEQFMWRDCYLGWSPVVNLTVERTRREEKRLERYRAREEAREEARDKANWDKIRSENTASAKAVTYELDLDDLLNRASAHEWTFKSGKTITAYFLSADAANVLVAKDGEHYKLPLKALTDADQELAVRLQSVRSKP